MISHIGNKPKYFYALKNFVDPRTFIGKELYFKKDKKYIALTSARHAKLTGYNSTFRMSAKSNKIYMAKSINNKVILKEAVWE